MYGHSAAIITIFRHNQLKAVVSEILSKYRDIKYLESKILLTWILIISEYLFIGKVNKVLQRRRLWRIQRTKLFIWRSGQACLPWSRRRGRMAEWRWQRTRKWRSGASRTSRYPAPAPRLQHANMSYQYLSPPLCHCCVTESLCANSSIRLSSMNGQCQL